jgi:hypothetical protein
VTLSTLADLFAAECSMSDLMERAGAARAHVRILVEEPVQFGAVVRSVQDEELADWAEIAGETSPDCRIAARKGELCGREVRRASTLTAPADSSKIVTGWKNCQQGEGAG